MLDKPETRISIEPSRRFVGRDFGPKLGSIALIRGAIDEIDTEIIRLMHERSIAVLAATLFKPTLDSVAQVERQAEVVGNAKMQAVDLGSPLEGFPVLVENVYRVMVSGYVNLQELAWEKTIPVQPI